MNVTIKEMAVHHQPRNSYIAKHWPMPTYVIHVELSQEEKTELKDQIDRGVLPF